MSCCGGATNCVNTSCIEIEIINGNSRLIGRIIEPPFNYNGKKWVQIIIYENKEIVGEITVKINKIIKRVLKLNTLRNNNTLNLSKIVEKDPISNVFAKRAQLTEEENNISNTGSINRRAGGASIQREEENLLTVKYNHLKGKKVTIHNQKEVTIDILSLINKKFDIVIQKLSKTMNENNKLELFKLNESIIKYLNIFRQKIRVLFKNNNITTHNILQKIDRMIEILKYINNMNNKNSPMIHSIYSETLKPFIELFITLITKNLEGKNNIPKTSDSINRRAGGGASTGSINRRAGGGASI
jgi:hypothetical protein